MEAGNERIYSRIPPLLIIFVLIISAIFRFVFMYFVLLVCRSKFSGNGRNTEILINNLRTTP